MPTPSLCVPPVAASSAHLAQRTVADCRPSLRSRFLTIFGKTLCLLAILCAATCLSLAQGDSANQAIGLPPQGSFDGSNFDSVQLNNGNLHIEIPLYTLSGRGLGVAVRYVSVSYTHLTLPTILRV